MFLQVCFSDVSIFFQMPRKYKRISNRGAPEDVLHRASEQVKGGSSIRAAANDFNIARMTLTRYMDKCNAQTGQHDERNEAFGYEKCRLTNMIFSAVMEDDLATHIKTLAEQFHGLSRNKCRSLIFEYAMRNNVTVPNSWKENGMTGEHFWISFKERNHLAIRTPEATSLARASAFNRYNVGKFYDNLGQVMDLHKFECHDIYNCDETGCTTVSPPENIVAKQGVKQVGSITSAEKGQLVTAVYTINAAGSVVPPMLIFPRKNVRDYFTKNGPPGCIGGANPSGWINEELFLGYLKHFIRHTRCSKEKKVLLILDNHETHISLAVIDLAKENGVILLTIPPHTSHKLQPLDVSCFKPFKTAYARAVENWMRSNPGKTITIYEIPEFTSHAQLHGLTAKNIISAFQSTGIYPYNRDVFSETDFAPATITNRDLPEELEGNVELLVPSEQTTETPKAGSSTTEPPAVQPGPRTTEPLVVQPGPTTTEPPAVQPGSSTTEPPAVQPGSSTTEPPAVQPGSSTTEPPAVQPGPRTTEPLVVQPGPTTTEPPAVQPGSSTTEPPAVQPGSSTTEPPAIQPGPRTTEPPAVQPGPRTTEPPAVQPGPSTTEPPAVQPGPHTTEPPAAQPGPRTTEPPAVQPGPSTTEPPAVQPGPHTTEPPAAQPGPRTTEPLVVQPGPSTTEPPAAKPGPSSLGTPASQPGPSNTYVSPADIVPLPKAGPRKVTNRGRKRGDTKILTNTPVRNSIAEALAASQTNKRKAKQPVKPKARKKLFKSKAKKCQTPSTSSEESGSDDVKFTESGDSDVDDLDCEIIEGDFAVVKFESAKSRIVHYIARIDVIDGNVCEGVFLKREFSRQQTTPTFCINNNDNASFPKNDIIKKLPAPKQLGGTARRAGKFSFPCDFTLWDFHSSLY
ncbi:uncharacterized protein LOC121389863 [Gigantopelta aegis]|uniref:uncharacterized protein LOC121389863 n=1 Tax=Gigantopelta aegis TaxID=1735272 RepID=UPI001B88B27C|nr:uncharacterized protein LOC121389863 [Gigantopelta aegis]